MPVVLCILDGWGVGQNTPHNAIFRAKTPFCDSLQKKYTTGLISASGLDVGLPDGQMGNSEVGHMSIGSGRIIDQSLVAATKSLNDISKNQDFINFTNCARGKTCHILGLLSSGGVHSHIDHINALVKHLQDNNVIIKLHAFLDGRDAPPKSALHYVLNNDLIATVSGRYWAMDRDNNWDRTERAYNTILGINQDDNKAGQSFATAQDAINHYYDKGITDEFIPPTKIANYQGIKDGDCIFFANFRADRMRQIASELLGRTDRFASKKNFCCKMAMAKYFDDFFIPTFLAEKKVINTLAGVVAGQGKRQLKIAETEKYAHVTYFFNGGKEEVLPGEDRIMIDSPSVATYNMQPQMSAEKITAQLVKNITSKKFDLIVVNYANADMVGHTGDFDATVNAIEVIDKCLNIVYQESAKCGYNLIITADHGNAECMYDYKAGMPHTYHTTNLVPFVVAGSRANIVKNGRLCDVMPTVLQLLGIEKPQECMGKSLLING